ncbi:MAG TPA: hydantoinase/oxoprolinase family protein [Ramlibacter sp.]|nr:hydantoinase/oxoprolinase family protein [Ramlibacter sp.]
MARFRVGIDIGGTFTDFVLEDIASGRVRLGKLLTTPSDPSDGVVQGLKRLLGEGRVAAGDVDIVVHGTTLATNAIIERTGARTALLTTAGFTDVLAIGRESRYDYYDLGLQLPEPLVPRPLRFGVTERVDREGKIVVPLDEARLADVARQLQAQKVESVAVCFLHSYRNAEHERKAAAFLARVAPAVPVSCSCDISPEIREYERTSTTVINAYLQPIVERYLVRLQARLHEMGFRGAFQLMLSSGLLTTVERAQRLPVRLIESGPAGGTMLGAFYSRLTGHRNLIAFDMGGTTAKASLIHEGEASVAREFEVGRIERFKKGSGYPVRAPCVDIVEIGTGGGSIAWIDKLGQVQVGPRSASSVPGPACYARGGKQPTVTDADLILGYIDPRYFLGGEMKLDRAAAEEAVDRQIAGPLGISVVQAALAIHRVANEDMANAFRMHAMEQGRDSSRYGLLAFGGAGPVHAWGVARILRSPSIASPAHAGVASALGFLVAPIAAEMSQSYISRVDRPDWSELNAILAQLEAAGRQFLLNSGVKPGEIHVSRSADMQYLGQMHDIAVPVPGGQLGPNDGPRLLQAFYDQYKGLFQRVVTRIPVEALTWRVTCSASAPHIHLKPLGTSAAALAGKGRRRAFFPEHAEGIDVAVFDRHALPQHISLDGPVIVEERESTLVVGPGGRLRMDTFGTLIVDPAPIKGATSFESAKEPA